MECKNFRRGGCSVWWNDLGKLDGVDSNKQGWLSNSITKKPGCGNNIYFWGDLWLDQDILSVTFQRLFNISTKKEATIAQMGDWRNGAWTWSSTWRRPLFVWEEELLFDLLGNLNRVTILPNVDDSWCWLGNCEAPYAVKTVYQIITSMRETGAADPIYKLLWENCAPLKVRAFCWRVVQDRVPTTENLIKRGVLFNDGSYMCCFCNSYSETCNHLFLFCKFAYFVWMYIYNWIGYSSSRKS